MGLASGLFKNIMRGSYKNSLWGDLTKDMPRLQKEFLRVVTGNVNSERAKLFKPLSNQQFAEELWDSRTITADLRDRLIFDAGNSRLSPNVDPNAFYSPRYKGIALPPWTRSYQLAVPHELRHKSVLEGFERNPLAINVNPDFTSGWFIFTHPYTGKKFPVGSLKNWNSAYGSDMYEHYKNWPHWDWKKNTEYMKTAGTGEVDAMLIEAATADKAGLIQNGLFKMKPEHKNMYWSMPDEVADYYKKIAAMAPIGFAAMNRDKPFYEEEMGNAP